MLQAVQQNAANMWHHDYLNIILFPSYVDFIFGGDLTDQRNTFCLGISRICASDEGFEVENHENSSSSQVYREVIVFSWKISSSTEVSSAQTSLGFHFRVPHHLCS